MKKVGRTSEFLFGIYWWTWKTTYLLEKLLKLVNKKYKNFSIYNDVFKKNKGKYMLILFYTCVPKILMIWNLNRLNLIIRSHFCQFIPFLKTQKIKILKKWKKYWRYHHFTHVYQEPQSYEVQFPRYGVKQTEFFVLLGTFLPFYPSNNPKHQNFEKVKKVSGDVIILYIKSQSLDQHMIFVLVGWSLWHWYRCSSNFLWWSQVYCFDWACFLY